jgi:hypothetical protein
VPNDVRCCRNCLLSCCTSVRQVYWEPFTASRLYCNLPAELRSNALHSGNSIPFVTHSDMNSSSSSICESFNRTALCVSKVSCGNDHFLGVLLTAFLARNARTCFLRASQHYSVLGSSVSQGSFTYFAVAAPLSSPLQSCRLRACPLSRAIMERFLACCALMIRR